MKVFNELRYLAICSSAMPFFPIMNHLFTQEGQDGPGSLTWFFEIALAIFFLSFSEKNLQEFLYVCTVQDASIH